MFVGILMAVFGIIGLLYAYKTYTDLNAMPAGNASMQEIAALIREGAIAFLRKESLWLLLFVGVGFFAALGSARFFNSDSICGRLFLLPDCWLCWNDSCH